MQNLYLIPTLLAPDTHEQVLPAEVVNKVSELNTFFVENIKSARRFISSLKIGKVIDDITFYDLTKDSNYDDILTLMSQLTEDIGILSEAGCPGVADPGAMAVDCAHQLGMKVNPMVGPSSILLALMGSGFNGQSFAFNGYLPIDKKERIKKLRELEKLSFQHDQTQLFMETPYRNKQMLEAIIQSCNPNTKLSIAVDITAPTELIKTQTVARWKQEKSIDLHKRPAIFSFGR
jgi:16S rRNA (cytidine1402-2'-O)-methyltransferase